MRKNIKSIKKSIFGLTLHQPWAQMIIEGHKNIENRSWKPPEELIGSFIAIHAGKTYDPIASIIIRQRFGIHIDDIDKLEMGAIVAVARLDGVLTDSDDPWFYGPYGWMLGDVTPIAPVLCPGAQRLWRLPESALTQVRTNFRLAATDFAPPRNAEAEVHHLA